MRRLVVSLTLLCLSVFALVPSALMAQDNRCFPETGFCISGPIRQYWERNGGLTVFGYPTTPLQTETVEGWTGPVQWFERDRLEDHSNERKGVLAGRLGVERLAQQGRPWQFRPLGGSVPGCRGFPETGYYLCGGFLTYWERNGGLARFGFPVTDQIVENLGGRDYTVQYFERRRMEYHPENRPPFEILLGLLGNEVRSGAGPQPPAPPTPTPLPVSQQIFVDEPAENAVISSPIRVSGRTSRVPAGNALAWRVYEPNRSELGSGTLEVRAEANGSGRYSSYIAYRAPEGRNIVIELTERDPRTGNVVARVQRNVRYEPTTAQRITIESPRDGDRVGTRIAVSGRTAIYPSEGDLLVNVLDSRSLYLASFSISVQGRPGEAGTFYTEFTIPDQGGRLVTVEIADINQRNDVLARARVSVFAGTLPPYPAP